MPSLRLAAHACATYICAALALCTACGLRLDNGPAGTGMDAPSQSSAQNQPSSSDATRAGAPNPEATLGAGPQPSFALTGSLAYQLEESSFLQCGFQEQWSARFEGLAFERLLELSLGEECDLGGCFFVLSGAGELSARGRYGQLRSYARELTVTRLTDLERVTRASDLPSLNGISCAR